MNDGFQIFCFIFFPLLPFPHITLQITSTSLETSAQSDNVTFCFCNCCGGFFFFFLICFTSTICIETIHRLDTFLIRTFVPLLLTANTDQPHTLCLCNNNARIILIIRIIITLITVVINILFIHKSWQQIRHGDAHDSRTQNSKAVQKHEFVFTLRMSVYLHFCLLDGCTKGFFCLMHLISTTYCSICCFDTDLRLFGWRHCYTTPTFLHLFEQRALSRSFVCFQIDMP